MLDDRHYMRPEYRPGSSLGGLLRLPASILLMIVLGACFLLQQVDLAYFRGYYESGLILSNSGLAHGHLWQLLTYQFLHVGLLHLLGNLIGIWFFGRYVEERLGKGRFLTLYFISGVVGGLFQSLLAFLFPYHFPSAVVGASAGVMALIAAFALMEPESPILLFFILPLRAKYLLYMELAVSMFFTIVPSDPGMAHAAHLGGILFAMGYMRWGLNLSHSMAEWNPFQRKIRRERLMKAAKVIPSSKLRRKSGSDTPTDLPSEEFISKEVDPILDKISAHGIQSLTERERAILQAARNKMSKR